MDKNCNEHESVIYEAFHVKITNIAEAQFPHLLHKTYTHIVYNEFRYLSCEIRMKNLIFQKPKSNKLDWHLYLKLCFNYLITWRLYFGIWYTILEFVTKIIVKRYWKYDNRIQFLSEIFCIRMCGCASWCVLDITFSELENECFKT